MRYADDTIILVKSEEAATRVKTSVIDFVENRMNLRINREKSEVRQPKDLNFLGHVIYEDGGLGLSRESTIRFKSKIREVTRRNRGISLKQLITELNPILRGWLNYFRMARMTRRLERLEGWLRRRIRCFRLKLCKRASGIFRFFRSRGLPEFRIWIFIGSSRSWFARAGLHAAHEAMNIDWFNEIGLYSLSANYRLFSKETAQYVPRTLGGVRGR